jgi:hypothetical protein
MSTMKIRAAAIRALADQEGRITAERVVDAARQQDHPLHHDFIWDDVKAAHQHRLDQARRLIASVKVVMTVDHQKFSVVGYVRDPDASPLQGYRAVAHVRTERDASVDVLLAEIERVKSILERAESIARALGLEGELQAALDATTSLLTSIETKSPRNPPRDTAASPPPA